jgi:hypothetical protein
MNKEISKEVLKQQGDAFLYVIDVIKKELSDLEYINVPIKALQDEYDRNYKIEE